MATNIKNATENAIKKAKKHFGGECIITGIGGAGPFCDIIPVDGCHIFPRSTHPALSYCMYNIVPLARHLHRKMDEHRPADRIEWLRAVVAMENREMLDQWLLNLFVHMVRAA